ncbi:MAG: YkgJ family cysteine cluster protein [Deltaproteobacteria bacterium]|nr:YkgJ family cysteine cluster protein [Deltaproteobacteria bacterium]
MASPLPWSRTERRAVLNEVRAVYRKADAAWAPFSCPASGDCCQLQRTGRQPWLYAGEWAVLVESLHGRPLPPPREGGGCPFLDASGVRCGAYADRPFGCRTFFCERVRGPGLQPAEVADALLRRLDAVHRFLDADGAPRPLKDWHRDAAGS